MILARSLADLIALDHGGNGSSNPDNRSVNLKNIAVDDNLGIDTLSADRITLTGLLAQGNLTIRSCRIEDLVVDHLTADGLLVSQSRIGRLTIRNATTGCDVTVSDTSLTSLDLHSCSPTYLERLRVEQDVLFAGLRGSVSMSNVQAASISFKSQLVTGRLGHPAIEVDRLNISEDIILDDLWLSKLKLNDLSIRNLVLRRVRLDEPLWISELRSRESIRINGLVIPRADSDETDSAIVDSDIKGAVDVNDLELPESEEKSSRSRLRFLNSTLARLTASSKAPSVVSLYRSSVTTTLGMPSGDARYELGDESNIDNIDLSGQTFRDARQVVQFLNSMFTGVSSIALESLRNALVRRSRPSEVDLIYYITRQRESSQLDQLRRYFNRFILGGALGWGVRIVNPVRTLLIGIVATALFLDASGVLHSANQGSFSPSRFGNSLSVASALWFNVGIGTPSELTSSVWTVLAVIFTASGLLLTTLIVGMIIRKIVRLPPGNELAGPPSGRRRWQEALTRYAAIGAPGAG